MTGVTVELRRATLTREQAIAAARSLLLEQAAEIQPRPETLAKRELAEALVVLRAENVELRRQLFLAKEARDRSNAALEAATQKLERAP
jgi:hypothetical protein